MNINPNFQHLRREEHEAKMHFSHLHQYVSAYEPSPEGLEDLRQAILQGLAEAKRDTRPVIVDQDGEMFIVCNPAGSISLCLRWKNYELHEPSELDKTLSVHGPYCSNYTLVEGGLVYCALPKGHDGPCEFNRII